jgi:YVTN family beta-propeller protein
VANSGDGTVTIVDLVSLHARKSLPVGPSPSGIRAHPTRDEIWGVSTGGGYVWVIDARSEEVVARIEVGAQPFAVDFSPDGKRAYVAASGAGNVVAIDCASRQVVGRARAGRRPWLARVTPDGKLLVVPNRDDNSVTLLSAEDLRHLATVAVAPRPEQVIVLRDSTKAFISAAGAGNGLSQAGANAASGNAAVHQVSVVDLVKPALLANLPLPATPGDLVLEPKDGKLLVPSPESHGLVIIDTWRNEVESFLLVGNGPYRATLSEKPETLYVSDVNAGVVTPVQFRFRRAAKPIPAGQRPGVCRLTPEKDLLLVVNEDSDDLAVIRTSTHSLITLVPVGSRPSDLAIKVF